MNRISKGRVLKRKFSSQDPEVWLDALANGAQGLPLALAVYLHLHFTKSDEPQVNASICCEALPGSLAAEVSEPYDVRRWFADIDMTP